MSDRPSAAAAGAIVIRALPAFRDNYIWLLSDGSRALVVDPGDAAPVDAALRAHALRLDAILVTHHHADHMGGAAELAQTWGARVYGPASEAIDAVDTPLAGGDRLPWAGLSFEVIGVPGHTAGHIAYYCAALNALFCGDTLFACGCGRLFEGTPAQMLDSLDKLAALPDRTLVHCAHEYTLSNIRYALAVEPDNPDLAARRDRCEALRAQQLPTVPSSMADEKRTNPFLRCDAASVCAAAERRQSGAGASRLATFTAIRAWKDVF